MTSIKMIRLKSCFLVCPGKTHSHGLLSNFYMLNRVVYPVYLLGKSSHSDHDRQTHSEYLEAQVKSKSDGIFLPQTHSLSLFPSHLGG